MPPTADAVFVDDEESLLTERLTDMLRERLLNASGALRRTEDDHTETHAANLTFDNSARHPETSSVPSVLFFFFVLSLLVFSLKYIYACAHTHEYE